MEVAESPCVGVEKRTFAVLRMTRGKGRSRFLAVLGMEERRTKFARVVSGRKKDEVREGAVSGREKDEVCDQAEASGRSVG